MPALPNCTTYCRLKWIEKKAAYRAAFSRLSRKVGSRIFRSLSLAFRGAGIEPPRHFVPAGSLKPASPTGVERTLLQILREFVDFSLWKSLTLISLIEDYRLLQHSEKSRLSGGFFGSGLSIRFKQDEYITDVGREFPIEKNFPNVPFQQFRKTCFL